MRDFLIQATITTDEGDGYTCTRQIPSFVLPAEVHGLVGPVAAERFALRMLGDIAGSAARVSVVVLSLYAPKGAR